MLTRLVILACIPSILFGSMADAAKDAKSFGKAQGAKAIQGISDDHWGDQERMTAAEAKQRLATKQANEDEAYQMLSSEEMRKNLRDNGQIHPDEYFLTREAEDLNAITHIGIESRHHLSCLQAGVPQPVSVIRSLHVPVTFYPVEMKPISVCKEHRWERSYYWKSDAQAEVSRRNTDMACDPTIEWYKCKISGGGLTSKYKVTVRWRHVPGTEICNNYRLQSRKVSDERWEEGDEIWQYEVSSDATLLDRSNCSLISQECVDEAIEKVINGKIVSRPCWKERLTFVCELDHRDECAFLKARHCDFVKKECVQEGIGGCVLWKKDYICYQTSSSTTVFGFSLDGTSPEEASPNDSFAEVVTKLSVMDELKKQLEASDMDADKVQLFSAEVIKCTRNVMDKAMYDCCFSIGGLAKDVGLARCTAEELGLAERRERGHCHYIGKYSEKLFNALWKSRDVHVFCCFPSKLARVFQEEARKQLGLQWGSPKKPLSRGLSPGEIARLNFSTLDLSEVFSDQMGKIPEDLEARLQRFEVRFEDLSSKHKEELHSRCGNL